MSETPKHDCSEPIPSPELLAAIMEFLELEDQGLTKDKLVDFLKRHEEHGPEFLRELKRCIRLEAFPPPKAVEEVERVFRSTRAGDDSGRQPIRIP